MQELRPLPELLLVKELVLFTSIMHDVWGMKADLWIVQPHRAYVLGILEMLELCVEHQQVEYTILDL